MPKSETKQSSHVLCVTVGRFSPFHKGNAKILRKAAPICEKIILFVAGQKESVENPFSYDLRKKIIKKSLGPVMYKTKIMPAVIKKGRKILQTGYVYSFLDRLEGLENVDGILVLVGADRYEEYVEQLKEIRKGTKKWNKVRVVNGGLGLNEFGSKIDASAIRGALLAGDTAMLKKYLADPIADNPNAFKEIYEMMKSEIETTYDAQQFEKVADKAEKSNNSE